MTRRISLTIGVAVVALGVGVPTALGKGQPPSAVDYFKANELATLVQSGESALTGYRDAFERGNVAGDELGVATYRDAFERGAQVGVGTGLESNVGSYRDAFERSNPQTTPVTAAPVGSGTEIEWQQVGIGLALGVALMLGLWLAMRITRIRPLAH